MPFLGRPFPFVRFSGHPLGLPSFWGALGGHGGPLDYSIASYLKFCKEYLKKLVSFFPEIHSTTVLCRVTWQPTFTATGSPAMWVG